MTKRTDLNDMEAKLEFIRAFFEGLEGRVEFLKKLKSSGRKIEATTLCSCYIDGLASALYWPDERNNFNFVRVLREYGGEEIFSYIHPKMLDLAISNLAYRDPKKPSRRWEAIFKKILPLLRKTYGKLYSRREIIALLSPSLSKDELTEIEKELWRGTFAAIVYSQMRLPSVHGFGPPDAVSFDKSTFKGKQIPPIGFSMVYGALKRIVSAAKELSLSTGKWFGHDRLPI